MRVFKLQNVKGDGSSVADAFPFYPDVDPKTGKPYVNDDGKPAVVVMLRIISRERYRDIVKANTHHDPTSKGGITERVDWDGVNGDACAYAIVSWSGFVGADDKALVCIDGTKRAIDTALMNAILSAAMYAQPAEVTAASFRQSADVPQVVGGLGENDPVLSARD